MFFNNFHIQNLGMFTMEKHSSYIYSSIELRSNG
jgi:hypothetical protein